MAVDMKAGKQEETFLQLNEDLTTPLLVRRTGACAGLLVFKDN